MLYSLAVLGLGLPFLASADIQFKITELSYGETTDMDQECNDLYGPGWGVGDAYDWGYQAGLSWPQLITYLSTAYYGNPLPYGFTAWTRYNGEDYLNGVGNRHFYIKRFDGNVPNTWTDGLYHVHDHTLDVAAWSGTKKILCAGPPAGECEDSPRTHEWKTSSPDIC